MSEDDKGGGRFELPLPPVDERAAAEMELYVRFMRHLRVTPSSNMAVKILSAIQFTADMMDIGDALAAKTLADLGLRAPRRALPAAYLEHVDRSLLRSGWDIGGPSASAMAMKRHWDAIGEDRFAAFRHGYDTAEALVGA